MTRRIMPPSRGETRDVPKDKAHSESFAWKEVARLARKVRAGDHPIATSEAIIRVADAMLAQVGRGVHANPPLLVFANPGKGMRGEIMSSSVLAIMYVHEDDDEPYVHGFANAELTLKTAPNGTVTITGLADRTDVEMLALDDGSVLIRGTHGQRLWDEF